MNNIISIRLNETEKTILQELKEYYFEETNIKLNTSDFIRFLINKEWSNKKRYLKSNKLDSS